MTRYLFKTEVSPQYFATLIRNPEDRTQAMRSLYEAMGGKLEAFYFGAGESTSYAVVQVPDEVALEAIGMAVFASGAGTSIKMIAVLLTAEEAVAAMKKAGSIAYKPPTS